MYNNVSREYKENMNAPLRNRMYVAVSLGVVNQEAQGNGNFTSELAEWSNKEFPWNNRSVEAEYATFEENFFKADGSMIFLPEEDEPQYNPNVGIASKDILGTITIAFPYIYDIKGITIDFGDAYPTSFKIVTNEIEHTYTNDKAIFETTDNLGETNTISIVPLAMVGGMQRLRIHKILMGVGLNYSNTEIQSMNIAENINAIANEVSSIDFDMTIVDPDNVYNVDNDDSFINYLQTGQPVNVSIGLDLENGNTEYVQIAKLLLSNWNSKKNSMSFSAVDKFVLMDEDYDDYRIHTRTLYDDAVDILTFCGFEPDEYIIDDCLRDVTVTNPLPKTSCKELLQLIANAGRCIIYQDRDGLIVFKANFATVIDPTDVSVSTNGHADWSKPQNVMQGSDYVYAEFTDNFFSADGSMYFLPENGEEYLETSYVSAQVADDNGNFYDNLILYPYQVTYPYTASGLTYTLNNDGSIHVKGTATANTWHGLHNNNNNTGNPWRVENVNFGINDILYARCDIKGTVKGKTGYMGNYKNTSSATAVGDIFSRYTGAINIQNGVYTIEQTQQQSIDPTTVNATHICIYLYFEKDTEVDATFYPMLTKLEDATIVPTHYFFGNKPLLTLELQAGFIYYGLSVLFDGNPPQQMVISTSYLGNDVSRFVIDNPEQNAYINETFKTFDKMVISFPKATPNNRVLVNKISFGELTDYHLTYNNIIGDVEGHRETKIKNVLVKVFSYTTEEGEIQEVDDNVYYTQNINAIGENITFENPLIGTMEHAQDVAEWLGFHYSNNVSYTAKYRGDPRLNASDLLYLESDVLNNLQVEIENHKLSFNGSLEGSLELRRAIRMEGA